MKFIRIFSRLFVGLVFMLSGFVKAVDPLGTAYKFSDYFEAFQLSFLGPLALILSILLSTAEIVIGINLLLGIRMKITSWVLLVFMTAFTAITLKLAISNPVSDCGCFGDAIILNNWQTFWKNIVLLVPSLVVFLLRNRFITFYNEQKEWILMSIFVFATVAFSLYNYNNLPLLDFRPYKIGANIQEKMTIPEGSPRDEYQFSFIYEKEGNKQEFTIHDLPDSSWSWVETKQKLLKQGYIPPIHDFSVVTSDGNDITDDVLSNPDYTFLIVAYDLTKADKKALHHLSELSAAGKDKNCSFICLTSSTFDVTERFIETENPDFLICSADNITLKTIVRSNPGLVLLKGGIVIGKWHYRNIPKELQGDLLSFSIDQMRSVKYRMVAGLVVLGFILMVVLFHLYNRE